MTGGLLVTCGDVRRSILAKVAVAQGLGRSRRFQNHAAVVVRTGEGGGRAREPPPFRRRPTRQVHRLRCFFMDLAISP